jgi:hypothetical protein
MPTGKLSSRLRKLRKLVSARRERYTNNLLEEL